MGASSALEPPFRVDSHAGRVRVRFASSELELDAAAARKLAALLLVVAETAEAQANDDAA